jgi:hypothetical protein
MPKSTTKGHVTIPKRLPSASSGIDIDFELAEDGRLFLIPKRPRADPADYAAAPNLT